MKFHFSAKIAVIAGLFATTLFTPLESTAASPDKPGASFFSEDLSNIYVYRISYNALLDTWIVMPTEEALTGAGTSALAFGSSALGSSASGSSSSDAIRINGIISESLELGLTDDETLIQQLTCHAYGAGFTNSEWNLEGYRPALDGDFSGQLIKGCNW